MFRASSTHLQEDTVVHMQHITSHSARYEATEDSSLLFYTRVSQPPGLGPVPGPGINYTGPREVLLFLAEALCQFLCP